MVDIRLQTGLRIYIMETVITSSLKTNGIQYLMEIVM
nr:MAG TPA: hypothetical protein [Bacteriophage sp.]DAH14096.1 MAG TPA: hypothetical protein [Caudoviricetes sp.]DAH37539.1 MAG TPA: hypothetical protein [Caudoviricetes sp.]